MHPITKKLIEKVSQGDSPSEALSKVLDETNGNSLPPVNSSPRPKVLAMDFDGTIVHYNNAAEIGELIPGVVDELRNIKKAGWVIVIWTSRPDVDSVRKILDKMGVPYDLINENPYIPEDAPKEIVNSRKIFADVYVDDRALSFDGKAEGLAARVTNFTPWYWR